MKGEGIRLQLGIPQTQPADEIAEIVADAGAQGRRSEKSEEWLRFQTSDSRPATDRGARRRTQTHRPDGLPASLVGRVGLPVVDSKLISAMLIHCTRWP